MYVFSSVIAVNFIIFLPDISFSYFPFSVPPRQHKRSTTSTPVHMLNTHDLSLSLITRNAFLRQHLCCPLQQTGIMPRARTTKLDSQHNSLCIGKLGCYTFRVLSLDVLPSEQITKSQQARSFQRSERRTEAAGTQGGTRYVQREREALISLSPSSFPDSRTSATKRPFGFAVRYSGGFATDWSP